MAIHEKHEKSYLLRAFRVFCGQVLEDSLLEISLTKPWGHPVDPVQLNNSDSNTPD
jgi:hypothetical protein